MSQKIRISYRRRREATKTRSHGSNEAVYRQHLRWAGQKPVARPASPTVLIRTIKEGGEA